MCIVKSYLAEVPEALLNSGILLPDNEPISAIALKCLIFLFYKLNSGSDMEINTNLSELCQMFGFYRGSSNFNYTHHAKRVVSHLKAIESAALKIRRFRGNGFIQIVLLERVIADIHKDRLKIVLSEEFAKYIKGSMYGRAAIVDLRYLFRLHKKADVTLYLLFTSHRYEPGYFEISKENISYLLTGTLDYPYKRIKADMINPALKCINSKTGFNVVMLEKKCSNKVLVLQFRIQDAPAADEAEHYCHYCNIPEEEYDPDLYDTDWQASYRYDFITQQYHCLTNT